VKAARKLRARRHSAQGVWFGLGMMGLIGWSVAVPTLLGAALVCGWIGTIREGMPGRWAVGSRARDRLLQRVHWVTKEDKAMRDEREDGDE